MTTDEVSKFIVYEWRHLPTGKTYVGYTKNVVGRWLKHESADSKAPYFNSFFKKHSNLNLWSRCILFESDNGEDALEFEGLRTRYWEKRGYELGEELLNLKHGGEGSFGRVMTAETRRKISEATKRQHEARRRMSETWRCST